MVFKKVKLKKLADVNTLSNDNSTLAIKSGENLPQAVWSQNSTLNATVADYVSTIGNDYQLYPYAIDSLRAQFKMHIKREIIPEYEGKQLVEALTKLEKELADTKSFSNYSGSIYDLIEGRIAEIAPKAYEWYSVARSQTAQNAGDMRLWVRGAVDVLDLSLQKLQSNLIEKSEDTVKTIFPANSSSQLYQPSSFGHHLLAFIEMFGRDRDRLKDARERLNESPFGSGEIVGNSFNLNREMVARTLSFDRAMQNSIDAICSRDFVVEFLSVIANSFVNVSRLAGEMISWHSSRNNYIKFDSSLVIQSSILPYKRDQVALEAVRAKASKAMGALMTVLSMSKDLPLEASADYKEMMDVTFNAFKDLRSSISVLSLMVSSLTLNRKAMKEAACKNFSTAQDLADWIVQKSKVSIGEAKARTRNIIDYAIEKDKKLSLLELDEIKKFEPQADEDIYSVLIPSRAIISRRSGNGSNPVQIRKALRAAKRKYL